MNPGTFLRNTDRMIPGFGYKKSVDVFQMLTASDGTALTGTHTNIGRVAPETGFLGIVGDSSGTFATTLVMKVPWDYDQSIDKMKLRFLASMAGATNATVQLDAALYQKKVKTLISSDLNPTISGYVPASATANVANWVEIVASELGLVAGSGLCWVVTCSAHTTDALWIYDAEIEYYSDLVYFDKTIRRS